MAQTPKPAATTTDAKTEAPKGRAKTQGSAPLQPVFDHTLRDIYYAERALLKALPKMARAAESDALKAAFRDHADETEAQIRLLDQVFAALGQKPAGEKCDAIEGLIKEADGVINEFDGTARDAALIGAAQAVEHYEIARYGTLREWAKTLGHAEVAAHLGTILDMEKAANAKLTGISLDLVA